MKARCAMSILAAAIFMLGCRDGSTKSTVPPPGSTAAPPGPTYVVPLESGRYTVQGPMPRVTTPLKSSPSKE